MNLQEDVKQISGLIGKMVQVDHRDPDEWFRRLVEMSNESIDRARQGDWAWKPDLGDAQDTYPYLIEAFAVLMRHSAELTYADVVGCVYMDIASRWKKSNLGQFFTPVHVADMMALISLSGANFDQYTVDRPMTVMDPACGSGIMLLGAAKALPRRMIDEGRVAFYGCDIDVLCVSMAQLNCNLYGLSGGRQGWVKHTDSLSVQEIQMIPEPHKSKVQEQLGLLDAA